MRFKKKWGPCDLPLTSRLMAVFAFVQLTLSSCKHLHMNSFRTRGLKPILTNKMIHLFYLLRSQIIKCILNKRVILFCHQDGPVYVFLMSFPYFMIVVPINNFCVVVGRNYTFAAAFVISSFLLIRLKQGKIGLLEKILKYINMLHSSGM